MKQRRRSERKERGKRRRKGGRIKEAREGTGHGRTEEKKITIRRVDGRGGVATKRKRRDEGRGNRGG